MPPAQQSAPSAPAGSGPSREDLSHPATPATVEVEKELSEEWRKHIDKQASEYEKRARQYTRAQVLLARMTEELEDLETQMPMRCVILMARGLSRAGWRLLSSMRRTSQPQAAPSPPTR